MAEIISDRWLNVPDETLERFNGISDYCERYGLFSGIGFISTTIYRTAVAAKIDWQAFAGINYPHVGALYVAFQRGAVAVLGTTIVCHRTESREQRRRRFASDHAGSEAFVMDFRRAYAGLPLLRFCEEVASQVGIPLHSIVEMNEPIWGQRTLKSIIFEGLSLDGEWRAGHSMLACAQSGKLSSLALRLRVSKLAIFLDRLYFLLFRIWRDGCFAKSIRPV
jgi:hypothetical protein